MRLIESECRTADWKPGAEVVLADGQVWHFPRPRLVYRMALDGDRKPFMKSDASNQSDTYAAALDRLEANGEGDASWFSLVTGMSLELLAQNYAIPDEAVPTLFTFDPGSEVSVNRWKTLGAAVKGLTSYPKP